MELVGAALDGLVELTARGVTELRENWFCRHGEAVHRVVGDGDEWTGHGEAVVVHAFNREVVVAGTLTARPKDQIPTPMPPVAGHAGIQQRQVQHAAARGGGRRIGDFLAPQRSYEMVGVVVSMGTACSVTSTVVAAPATVAVMFAVARLVELNFDVADTALHTCRRGL